MIDHIADFAEKLANRNKEIIGKLDRIEEILSDPVFICEKCSKCDKLDQCDSIEKLICVRDSNKKRGMKMKMKINPEVFVIIASLAALVIVLSLMYNYK